MRNVVSIGSLLALFVTGLCLVPSARGTMVWLDYTTSFDGEAPQGDVPWLAASFDDEGTPGSVVLVLGKTNNLVGSEFVSQWYFNSEVDPSSLVFTHLSGPAAVSVGTGAGSFQADGDGKYDILLLYDPGDFAAGDMSVYRIEGTGLTALNFNGFSEPGGLKGSFKSAAEVGGIGELGQDKGFIGAPGERPIGGVIPEPSTMLLVGTGLLGAGILRRKKRH